MGSYAVAQNMLEDLLHESNAKEVSKSCFELHAPTFLGIQDRRATKELDKKIKNEQTEVFEIDDDGPLREEYLPKRRSRHMEDHSRTVFNDHLTSPSFCDPKRYVDGSIGLFLPKSISQAISASNYVSSFPYSSFHSSTSCCTSFWENDPYRPRIASTLCDDFLSYSRIRVY